MGESVYLATLSFGSRIRCTKGKTMNRKVSIVIEKDENGYYAYCPELPGCQTQGDTFEEINANIKEAVELYIETLSPEEVEPYLSREIYTTAMEVSFA
jgi:predicted RNase H-like HicB family nuclease